jgi:competence protein ComEC
MNKKILLFFVALLVSCNVEDIADTIKSADTLKSLEIHIINVQQGDSTLVIGPNGTTLLIDGGDTGHGKSDVVPYLKGLGIENGIDYMVNTHRDEDHLGGLDEVIEAGYDVRKRVWDNGSEDKTGMAITDFLSAANGTTAGKIQQVAGITLGQVIDLGNGARATAVASGGTILGTTTPFSVTNENDKSIALLISYGLFDYIMTGDLGGGDDDTICTGRTTDQRNMESLLVHALMPGGSAALLPSTGIEAMMAPHHGSESSTNSDYMNFMTPRVAVISTGEGQGGNFQHPRKDIVENVLLAGGTCITAPKALVLQTDEGSPMGEKTSTAGFVSGDIVIKSNGVSSFQVSGSGRIRDTANDERVVSGINVPLTLPLD